MTATGQRTGRLSRLVASRAFWAGVALLAAVVLALGLALWASGSPAVRGVRWVCFPAGMECTALTRLLGAGRRVIGGFLVALAWAWIVAWFVLLAAGS